MVKSKQKLEIMIDIKTQREARLGVLFMKDFLLDRLPEKDRNIAIKRGRSNGNFFYTPYGIG